MGGKLIADNNGVGIHYEVAGQGPPVILLHGFPDSGRVWRHQVLALADAGFQVIVPDLRGYGRSDKPGDVAAYAMPYLEADVVAILDQLQVTRAHVVGHDWGAGIAWRLAILHPDRVDHLAVLSVGHPAAFAGAGLAQREKSWYMLLFQFHGVAEQCSAATTGPTSAPGPGTPTRTRSSPNWRPAGRSLPDSAGTGPTCRPKRCSPNQPPFLPFRLPLWGSGAARTSP
jgi:pimeloyl-ACP methyl ester carboxylesterase